MSNSKLTQTQKAQLKAYKANMPEIIFVSSGRVTIAAMVAGKDTAKFGVSIEGGDEIKSRKNVGEYYALNRLLDYGMPFIANEQSLRYVASQLASTMDYYN